MTTFYRFILSLFAGLLIVACNSETTSTETQPDENRPTAKTSVVRVHSTVQSYNFVRPWEKARPITRSGLGSVISGNRVLVTGEMVADHTYIELEKADTGEKTPARVMGVDYEANLAIVVPEDSESTFLDDMIPLEFDASTSAGDTVEVWQLEDNGTPASTPGLVIKAGIGRYFVDGSYFLNYVLRGSLQYRAGSFTLPVVKDGKLIGLLLTYNSKEQTSEIISTPIIQHFISDLEDGEYNGFPNLGVSYAQTLDEQLRKYAKIDDVEGGVFIRRVAKDGSAAGAGIEVGDVILAINGHTIDSRGNYDHPEYGKLNFSHLVRGDANVGDTVTVDIVREGEKQQIEMELLRKKPTDYLVDPYMYDRGPRFLIEGGMIFQELTLPYLKAWGGEWANRAPFKLVHAHAHQDVYEEQGREKLVVMTAVLRTPGTLGYEGLNNIIISKVNNQEILSLTDLKDALENPIDGIHRIEFDDFPKLIFVDAAVADQVNDQLGSLGIPELERLD